MFAGDFVGRECDRQAQEARFTEGDAAHDAAVEDALIEKASLTEAAERLADLPPGTDMGAFEV